MVSEEHVTASRLGEPAGDRRHHGVGDPRQRLPLRPLPRRRHPPRRLQDGMRPSVGRGNDAHRRRRRDLAGLLPAVGTSSRTTSSTRTASVATWAASSRLIPKSPVGLASCRKTSSRAPQARSWCSSWSLRSALQQRLTFRGGVAEPGNQGRTPQPTRSWPHAPLVPDLRLRLVQNDRGGARLDQRPTMIVIPGRRSRIRNPGPRATTDGCYLTPPGFRIFAGRRVQNDKDGTTLDRRRFTLTIS